MLQDQCDCNPDEPLLYTSAVTRSLVSIGMVCQTLRFRVEYQPASENDFMERPGGGLGEHPGQFQLCRCQRALISLWPEAP